MTTTMRVRTGRGWGAKRAAMALAAIALAAGGCHSGPHAARDASHPGAGGAPASGGTGDAITIDGRFQDWPKSIATTADADWVYFKVTVPDLGAPLQAAPETLALWLDADGSGKTGARMATPKEASGLGVDAIVEFSPPGDKGEGTKRGVVVYAADESGRTTPVPSAIAEVLVAPTHISDTYELRLSRHVESAASPALARILAGKGRAKAMYALIGRDGALTGWSDPETFTMPAAGASPTLSDVTVPAKADGTVRILSWNVLKSELMKNPGPFARVIQVANPDIILLQEWETDAATAQSWFTATVTGTHVWNARTLPGTDVVIVSAFPLTGVGPQSITTETPAGAGSGSEAEKARNVRFVAAMAQTPLGNVLVGTAHLKCCGTVGSPEDARRINEASAINAAMSVAFAQEKAPVRVIAGDFNLVGSRAPIDLLRAGLDADGSELAVATTPVLGDRAVYTWSDPKTEFPDGRLDYALYSDATADLANAFVLDARRLSDRSLAKMGLDRGDTGASDHFPVVIDVRPRK